jgi:N4-gp56 family major capsid protein
MQDDDWIRASHYGKPEQLFSGEVGRLDGVRYVEHTNPFTHGSDQAQWDEYDADGVVVNTLFTGKGAYGAPKLAGTGTPWKPQVLITPDQASDSDPLNQRRSVGWKVFWNSILLNENYVVRMLSRSTFN